MIFRKYKKTPSSSGGRNFTNFWSSRILKYIGHVYSSRALHFWHWFLGPPTLNPSNPTRRNHKNRNFSVLGRKSLKILENHEISRFSKNTIDLSKILKFHEKWWFGYSGMASRVARGIAGRRARAARAWVELEWYVIVLQLPTYAQQLL